MKTALATLAATTVLALGAAGVAGLTNLGSGTASPGGHAAAAPTKAPEADDEHGQGEDAGPVSARARRAAIQAHRDGMKQWQACHRAHRTPCLKPLPPGWAMHPEKHPGGWPPQAAHGHGHGKPDHPEQSEKPDDRD